MKKIKGYENYTISKEGRVFNTKTGYELKQFIDGGGYWIVHLSKQNVTKNKRIHRLVAQAFIPNPLNKPCINHKNGMKTDNRIDNLEWCTHKENMNHALDNNLIKMKKIYQYDLEGNLIKIWKNFRELKEKNKDYLFSGISTSTSDEVRSYKGYIWRYENSNVPIKYQKKGISNQKKVYQYDLDNNFIKEWGSIKEIEKHYKFAVGCVSKCCNGHRKTAGGYIWFFEKQGGDT